MRWRLLILRARVNGQLSRFKVWRWIQFTRIHLDGCTCTFADAEVYLHSSHPTDGCKYRTDCRGWTTAGPPCGGCDVCIDQQQDYYDAKARGML